jgi:hypothetical protein
MLGWPFATFDRGKLNLATADACSATKKLPSELEQGNSEGFHRGGGASWRGQAPMTLILH